MKKIIVPILIAIFLVTGCGAKKETVKCTMSQSQTGFVMNSDLEVEIKDKKFSNIDLKIDVIVDDSLMAYKSELVPLFEDQFASFESQYGVKVKVTETAKGVTVSTSMSAAEAEKFYGKASKDLTKKEVVETFEAEGYTCK